MPACVVTVQAEAALPKVARTFVRNRARMRANVWTLTLAIAVLALATIADRRPFDAEIHGWGGALAVALAGIWLLVVGLRSISSSLQERCAGVGALGGVVIAVAFVGAELLVGPPQRVGAAPGQTYRPPHGGQLAVLFPPVSADDLRAGRSPASVDVMLGAQQIALGVDREVRVHSYVLRANSWPASYVQAWSSHHVAQTVTQPTGGAFVSPVLQFPGTDKDGLPVDSFAVPALHRDVRLKYYPGLPSRGIDIPFIQLEIDEENGGALFSGVAVSGRPLKKAGMELVFELGNYPVVSLAGAPDRLVYAAGAMLLLVGIVGFAISALLAERTRTKDD